MMHTRVPHSLVTGQYPHFPIVNMLKQTSKSRRSSVGIVTRLRVARQRNRVYYPSRRKRCFSSQRIQTGSWANLVSASVNAGSTLSDLKQPRSEADLLPPCNAEVKNLVTLCQRHPIRLHAVLTDILSFSHLKTKRRTLYLKTQFVPRSKHFTSVIKTNQFML